MLEALVILNADDKEHFENPERTVKSSRNSGVFGGISRIGQIPNRGTFKTI